jgi:hypothetical protein
MFVLLFLYLYHINYYILPIQIHRTTGAPAGVPEASHLGSGAPNRCSSGNVLPLAHLLCARGNMVLLGHQLVRHTSIV